GRDRRILRLFRAAARLWPGELLGVAPFGGVERRGTTTNSASTWQLAAQSPVHAAALVAAFWIIAAPFSAIIIVGALVLVEVTAGIPDASMPLSASSPCTRSSSSTTLIA